MVAPHGFFQRDKGKRAFPWLGLYQGGGQAVAVFWNSGAPSNGVTLAGIAQPGSLLATDEPAFYQNTNSLASPTWTATSVAGANTVTNLVATGYIDFSYATGLVAVGTNRGTSLALTHQINNVVTTTSTATGVTLPTVATVGVGGFVRIINNGTTSMHVYGAGSDTIDGQIAATGVVLTNAFYCDYWASAAATWLSNRVAFVISA